jgi:hypothetical protein
VNNSVKQIFDWIREDHATYPIRFYMEVAAWAVSIGCSLTMALTVPNPPLVILYPIWIGGCVIYAWAAWTRRSFGMLANYCLLVTIDSFALLRLWAHA